MNKGPSGPLTQRVWGLLPQKILKSESSEMPFTPFWAPNHHTSTSGNYSLCMAIRCEIKLKQKHIPASIAILGTGQTTLLTKREGCICTRKRSVAFLIFHPFVSFLFLRTHSSREKHTRIVCQPARQAAETIIRSISCSLQLRLKSNERKKFGDKMLKWTFGYDNFFLK